MRTPGVCKASINQTAALLTWYIYTCSDDIAACYRAIIRHIILPNNLVSDSYKYLTNYIDFSVKLSNFSLIFLYILHTPLTHLYGPALMAEWSKALPLTTSCLSPLPGFESHLGTCEKVTCDLRLGGGFRRILQVSSTSYNWLVTTSIAILQKK